MTPFARWLRPASILGAAALTAVSAAAAEPVPRDYVLPFAPLDPATHVAHGVMLSNAAEFTQRAVLVAASETVRQPHLFSAATLADGTDLRPQTLVYVQGGRWMKADLRSGLNPAPAAISSESGADAACGSMLLVESKTSGTASILYSLPGPDAVCGTADDRYRRSSLSGTAASAPQALPVGTLDLHPVYVAGTLAGVLSLEGGQVKRYAPDFSTSRKVVDGATLQFWGQADDGTAIVTIDGVGRRIAPSGTTPLLAMKRAAHGYAIRSIHLSDGTAFIFEDAVSANSKSPTKVFRIAQTDSAVATLMLQLKVHGEFAAATSTRLLYRLGGGVDAATSAPIPTEVRSTPRDTSAFTNDTVRIFRVANGSIPIVGVRDDEVFFNALDLDAGTTMAYVRSDIGQPLLSFGPGAAWMGGQVAGEPGIEAPTLDVLMLARGGRDPGDVKGARLVAVLASDLSSRKTLATLNPGVAPAPFAPVTAAALLPLATPADVYGVDLEQLRYRRLTTAGGGAAPIR